MDSDESGWMSHSRSRLFDALEDDWNRRKTGARPNTGPALKPKMSQAARLMLPEFIKSGYRAMSLKYHPDKGGTAEQMRVVKEVKEVLEKL
jgi:hypothetical protein